MPSSQRRSSIQIYGGFVNPISSVTYVMIGGPLHQTQVTLPHQVNEYKPIVEGNEETYFIGGVTLFGRRMPVLLFSGVKDKDAEANAALAHGLLSNPDIYTMWHNAQPVFPGGLDVPVASGMDDTRVEKPLVDNTTR